MFLLLLYVALNVEMTTEMIATISFVLIAAILGCVSTTQGALKKLHSMLHNMHSASAMN